MKILAVSKAGDEIYFKNYDKNYKLVLPVDQEDYQLIEFDEIDVDDIILLILSKDLSSDKKDELKEIVKETVLDLDDSDDEELEEEEEEDDYDLF